VNIYLCAGLKQAVYVTQTILDMTYLYKYTIYRSQVDKYTRKIHTLHLTKAIASQYRVNNLTFSKGKAKPLQPLTGPEGSRRLRLPDFKTIGI
jgi:hypothetical protein